MLLEKGHVIDLLPCAGITLTRFYGFNLSLCRYIKGPFDELR
jgi:hypothetical protein